MNQSRRNFITHAALLGAGATVFPNQLVSGVDQPRVTSINVFSKTLQWLNYDEMASVVKNLGFDGIELTVRPQGHVTPESVETDLPRAVGAARKAGLNVPMIVTAIGDSSEPYSEKILQTASEQGVKSYRMNWFSYEKKRSVNENLAGFRKRFQALEKLNRKYRLRGEYQNHQGQFFGSAIWDLWAVVKDFDPAYIAIQFDAFHAAVEGFHTWPNEFDMVKSHIGTLAIKDLGWAKKENKWTSEVVPFGEGAVDYPKYVDMIKAAGLNVPYTIHYEYALGGAENGARTLSIPRDEVLRAMRRDLENLKSLLK